MGKKKIRGLRRGFTTGTCAAAASKAAVLAFITKEKVREINITLPAGHSVTLPVFRCKIEDNKVIASIIKDGGDDPDVTSGAEIVAEVTTGGIEERYTTAFKFRADGSDVTVYSGEGIGIVTRKGLAVSVGEPAINPVPRKMIEYAVKEAINLLSTSISRLFITISVPEGEKLAQKTTNARLGIIGGISILGTTGIVEPLSLSAYRQSIECAVNVAIASGCRMVVLSTGRSSEKGVQGVLGLPEESYILVGDHMGFALRRLKNKVLRKEASELESIIIAGQFAKLSKIAAGHFQTHISKSHIELDFLAGLTRDRGGKVDVLKRIEGANTAREVFYILQEEGMKEVLLKVCELVRSNAERITESEFNIDCFLIGYDNDIVIRS